MNYVENVSTEKSTRLPATPAAMGSASLFDKQSIMKARAEYLKQAFARGETVDEIVRRTGVSRYAIDRIIKSERLLPPGSKWSAATPRTQRIKSDPTILRAARAILGLTQADMAKELGVHHLTYLRYEKGSAYPDELFGRINQLMAKRKVNCTVAPKTLVLAAG
jgi:transcriptional regulator with XRE-family HTH domain